MCLDAFRYDAWLNAFPVHTTPEKFENAYSRTSGKGKPKMMSLGGHLWEVVAYESLDNDGPRFFLISPENMVTAETHAQIPT